MLIDLDSEDGRPFELIGVPYKLLRWVHAELGAITASGLEEVLLGRHSPRDIVFEPFEIRWIRERAEYLGMESPV
jgi:hypothetical protein